MIWVVRTVCAHLQEYRETRSEYCERHTSEKFLIVLSSAIGSPDVAH